MPRTDRDVFDRLTDDTEVSDELAFIAYALFAHERREWIRHYEQMHGSAPSAADVEAWIANLTDSQFTQIRIQAASFFDAAARSYLADEIEQREGALLQSELIRNVKAAGSFWKQLSIALITAILAPVIIGAVIAAALVFSDRFPTIRDIGSRDPGGTTAPHRAP